MSLLPFPNLENVAQHFDFDRFMDMIGEGSFAFVYKAIRREPLPQHGLPAGSPVALKVIQKAKLSNDAAVRDVIKEVEIGRKLRHRGCVPIYEVLQTTTEIFIVMELVDGVELFSLIREAPRGRLPEAVAASITAQLLDVTGYLHSECRVVHRDLKPENVLISGEVDSETNPLRVRVVDFGLAKYIGTSQRRGRLLAGVSANRVARPQGLGNLPGRPSAFESAMERTVSTTSVDSLESASSHATSPLLTTPCGTLKYNAPEAVQTMMSQGAAKQQTTKGDLVKREMFSIGVVVYVMLSGQLPFVATGKSALLQQMNAGASFFSSRWANVSDSAKALTSELLKVDPATRPSARECLGRKWIHDLAPQYYIPSQQELSEMIPVGTNVDSCDADDDVNVAANIGRQGMALAFDAVNDQLKDEVANPMPYLPSDPVPRHGFLASVAQPPAAPQGHFPEVVPCPED